MTNKVTPLFLDWKELEAADSVASALKAHGLNFVKSNYDDGSTYTVFYISDKKLTKAEIKKLDKEQEEYNAE